MSARAPFRVCLVLLLAHISSCQTCDDCDRSTRRSSYQPPDERTVLPGGGIILTERPAIPEHLRANCHVCPEWCKQADLRPVPPDTVIATYREHAVIYADKTRRSRWPDGWGKLEQMGCIVAGGGEPLQHRFLELLRDPDPAIRWPASVHALQHDMDTGAALATLRAMAGTELDDGTVDGPDGPEYANRARIVLMEYEIGNPVMLP
jgi:hypothetical protein